VTSKLQVTIPKVIADRYGIEPGSEIDFLPAGEAIRVVPVGAERPASDVQWRLELFDRATERQRQRDRDTQPAPPGSDRGWRREDAYERDSAR
jgi:AbrB family looped-hinge helix DNA binding protein